MREIQSAIGGVPWLQDLGSDERAKLAHGATVRVFEHGAIVPLEDVRSESFLFVVRGAVKLIQRDLSGRATILQIYASGELVDGASSWLGLDDGGSIVVLGDETSLLSVRRDAVQELTSKDPALACSFLDELAAGCQKMRARVADMAITPVPRRIARVLARLATSFGATGANGVVEVDLPLSRQDVADLCGTTIETAIRVMSRLQGEGILRKARHGVHIADRDKLEEMSSGETSLRAR